MFTFIALSTAQFPFDSSSRMQAIWTHNSYETQKLKANQHIIDWKPSIGQPREFSVLTQNFTKRSRRTLGVTWKMILRWRISFSQISMKSRSVEEVPARSLSNGGGNKSLFWVANWKKRLSSVHLWDLKRTKGELEENWKRTGGELEENWRRTGRETGFYGESWTSERIVVDSKVFWSVLDSKSSSNALVFQSS